MLQQNLFPNDFQLKDLLNLFKKEILLQFNCHHVGTIQSFNAIDQIAQVTINYTKTFLTANPAPNGQPIQQQVSYPILANVPVICLGGGNGALTFPIESGDECLLLFNDRDIDNWFQGATGAPVNSGRLHSFTDAIALVGLNSLPNAIPDYNTGATELRNYFGTSKVGITDNAVTLTFGLNTLVLNDTELILTLGATGTTFKVNTAGQLEITNLTGEFVSVLIQLFTDIATGQCAAPGNPLVMPTFAADLAQLETFKS